MFNNDKLFEIKDMSDFKRIFRFDIGKFEVQLSYSHLRPLQLKLYTPDGFRYWNLFFGKLLLTCHKLPF